MASSSVWISVPLCMQVGISVSLWACFVWPLLVSEWDLALWNKTLLYSTPTFTHFPIKQLSGCPGWPLREYCKPSIVSPYRLSQGGSNESPGPLRASTCTLRPLQCVWIEIGDGYLSLFLPFFLFLSHLCSLSFTRSLRWLCDNITESRSGLMKTEGGGGATALCVFFFFLTMAIFFFLTLLSLSFFFSALELIWIL